MSTSRSPLELILKKVITYGTFDLFHDGHRRLLERARDLGDYLIVGVTTQSYDSARGKLNVRESLIERIDNVRQSGLADEIVIEESLGQKIDDIQKHSVSVFAIGSDWLGAFDYLEDYCEVVYLERTRGISSTELRQESNGVLTIGIAGNGRIANRFIAESKYVSGVNVEGVFGRNPITVPEFADHHELSFWTHDLNSLLEQVDAVYIASPHLHHYPQVKQALEAGKHVLCEKPMTLDVRHGRELYDISRSRNLVLLEAIKTAFAPGFLSLVSVARSGVIGSVRHIDATFTKLVTGEPRELNASMAGGSMTELASYPLLAIAKILGTEFNNVTFDSIFDSSGEVDLFTQVSLRYPEAMATATVGLGVKSEGDMVISGTRGHIYVPAPWWKTDFFELRFEDQRLNKRYSIDFAGDGLRYEIAEFVRMVNEKNLETYKLRKSESLFIQDVISRFRLSHASPKHPRVETGQRPDDSEWLGSDSNSNG